MRKLIERCPACGGLLTVSRMQCPECSTGVEGHFRPSTFDRLSPESLAFVELFVRLKGNMKEMERELSVAYSAVRHRLDEVVQELGPAPDPTFDRAPDRSAGQGHSDPPGDDDGEKRQDILARLERGEITPDEAVRLLGGDG